MRSFDAIIGYYVLETEREHSVSVINRMRTAGIEFTLPRENNSERFRFCVLKKDKSRLDSLLDKSGISVYIIYGKGLPFLLRRIRFRPGLIVGALLFFIILTYSSRFIWDVTVSGNTTISDTVIFQRLGTLGFGIGERSRDFDYDELCNSFLRRYDDISWITVNVKGSRAEILLREASAYDTESDNSPSNLVAKFDGQIESMTVFSGKEVVAAEDTVRAGDLLVTGVIDSGVVGMRLERSTGSVYAYVNRSFTVSVPLTEVVTEKTECYHRKSLKILNFDFLLPSRDNRLDFSEAEPTAERLILFDRISLPIFINTETVYETTEGEKTYTEAQVEKIAGDRMSEKIFSEIDGAILRRKTYSSWDGGVFTLRCDIHCICDIAREEKLDIK